MARVLDNKAQSILDAARVIISRRGYQNMTISQLSAEAGVSRGLLHYYFKNKAEILSLIVHQNIQRSIRLITHLFTNLDPQSNPAKTLTLAIRRIVTKSPEDFSLYYECWVVARQDQNMWNDIARYYEEFRTTLADGLASISATGKTTPAIPRDEAATILTSFIDGIGLQLLVDPKLINNDQLWDSIEKTFSFIIGIKEEMF